MKGLSNHWLTKLWIVVCGLVFFSTLTVQAQESDKELSAQERQRLDSINIWRGYVQSKHYRDSVEQVRLAELAAIRAERQRLIDSIAADRKRRTDSLIAARKHFTDSVRAYNDSVRVARAAELAGIKAERQRIADSLSAIRAYKKSDHYKDSVALVRQQTRDSIAAIRKQQRDSLAAVQKAIRDSTIAERKRYNDSLRTALEEQKAERMRLLDSMAVVRQERADSMAKVRAARAAERKANLAKRTKEQEKKKSLALELEIKKKQEAYTNEKMRRKKWSLPRKIVQNTFTRYNYYFNADLKMDEAIDNMLRSKVDNYDSLITLFPFDPDLDSTKLAPDMDTIIRKASVGIQIHDPRAKWQDDLYLMVGQAYYYKGDYKNAAAAFQYIIAEAEERRKEEQKRSGKKNDKDKVMMISEPDPNNGLVHKSVKNEAVLWLSRTLSQSNKIGQAQALLDMLSYDENFPKRLQSRLALEQAFIHLRGGELDKVPENLELVVADKDMPQWLRLRAAYLTGQILQQQRKYAASNEYFALVGDLHPNLEMDFYALKNQAVNSLAYGGNKTDAGSMLSAMAADAKFRPYYDQIYYAMGQAELQKNRPAIGLAYLQQSLDYNQNNKRQRGLTHVLMADEYYSDRKYLKAGLSYDSAASFLRPVDEPYYSVAVQRAQALKKIAAPGEEVRKQDSLLALSQLPESEQRKVVRDYIKDWEKQQSDSLFQAQNARAPMQQMTPGNLAGGPSWYFSNPELVQRGVQDFKNKWGDRELKDNWRRSSASSGIFDMPDDMLADQEFDANRPNEDSLMAAIPKTPEQLQQAHRGLEEGLFQLGKGYYTYLEDYPNATKTFDTLDKRYPNNNHEAEVLYTRYLMALRQNDQQTAVAYNQRLQSEHPDSEWARMLVGTSSLLDGSELYATNKPAVPISNHYDETYGLLMQRQYSSVLQRVNEAEKNYPRQGSFQKKYHLMKAIAVAGTGRYPEADTMLQQFVSAYPNDSLTNWANTVLDYIRQQKYPEPAATVAPTSAAPTERQKPTNNFVYNPQLPHIVMVVAEQDSRLSALKSGVIDYNLMNPGKSDVVVTITSVGGSKGIVLCRGFANANDAKQYLNDIKKVQTLFREYTSAQEYELLLITEDNLSRVLQSNDWNDYKHFYRSNYR